MLRSVERSRRPVAPRHGGFTLIELLVASVLGALLAGIVLQLLSSQSRFVDYQEARQEVQENTRAARELIVSELRSVTPAGIDSATTNRIVLRVPRVWGVVCAIDATGGSVDIVVPAELGTSYSVGENTARPGLASQSGSSDTWTYRSIMAISISGAGAPADCAAAASSEAEIRRFAVSPSAISAPAIGAGDIAYLYDRITYLTGFADKQATAPGRWVYRRIGTGHAQPLAGPIAGPTKTAAPKEIGLRFRYFSTTSPLIPDPTSEILVDPAAIRRIEVVVHSLSRGSFAGEPQAEVDSTSVFLRSSG